MSYTVKATDLGGLTLNETDVTASVLQNVAIILNTWKGECPLYRDFGISPEVLHRPINAAKALLQAEIIEAINTYEPRAIVNDITFTVDSAEPDRLIPIVELEVDDGT